MYAIHPSLFESGDGQDCRQHTSLTRKMTLNKYTCIN